MKTFLVAQNKSLLIARFKIALILFTFLFTTYGCSFSIDSGSNSKLQETQAALTIQETQISQKVNENLQATLAAQQAALEAQAAQQQAASMAATQVALSVQATVAAAQPAAVVQAAPAEVVAPPAAAPVVPVQEPAAQPPAAQAPVQVLPPAQPAMDMESLMKSANIVIYEDMVNVPEVYPYVKRTLDKMGLNYKNDGSAKGWLKNDLLIGAKNGDPWDLVIIAVEYRGGISGEYFDYVMDVLNKGSSVIIEAYHLDQISQGTASTILATCGLNVKNYVGKTRTLTDLVVWPISNASHPILNEPNSGLSFTKAVYYWPWSDLGSLMNTTNTGDGQILLGLKPNERDKDGVLATCLDGQLTLMTMSSHSYSFQTIMPLWENMIYQALKTRFSR